MSSATGAYSSASGASPSASGASPSVSPAAATPSDNSIPNAVSLCSLLCLHLQRRFIRQIFIDKPHDPTLADHPIWAQRGLSRQDALRFLDIGAIPDYLLEPGVTQEFDEGFFQVLSHLHAVAAWELDFASTERWSTPHPARSVSSTATTVVDDQLRRSLSTTTPMYTFGAFHVHDQEGEDTRDREETLPILHARAALGYVESNLVPELPAAEADVVNTVSPPKRAKSGPVVSCSDQDDDELVTLASSAFTAREERVRRDLITLRGDVEALRVGGPSAAATDYSLRDLDDLGDTYGLLSQRVEELSSLMRGSMRGLLNSPRWPKAYRFSPDQCFPTDVLFDFNARHGVLTRHLRYIRESLQLLKRWLSKSTVSSQSPLRPHSEDDDDPDSSAPRGGASRGSFAQSRARSSDVRPVSSNFVGGPSHGHQDMLADDLVIGAVHDSSRLSHGYRPAHSSHVEPLVLSNQPTGQSWESLPTVNRTPERETHLEDSRSSAPGRSEFFGKWRDQLNGPSINPSSNTGSRSSRPSHGSRPSLGPRESRSPAFSPSPLFSSRLQMLPSGCGDKSKVSQKEVMERVKQLGQLTAISFPKVAELVSKLLKLYAAAPSAAISWPDILADEVLAVVGPELKSLYAQGRVHVAPTRYLEDVGSQEVILALVEIVAPTSVSQFHNLLLQTIVFDPPTTECPALSDLHRLLGTFQLLQDCVMIASARLGTHKSMPPPSMQLELPQSFPSTLKAIYGVVIDPILLQLYSPRHSFPDLPAPSQYDWSHMPAYLEAIRSIVLEHVEEAKNIQRYRDQWSAPKEVSSRPKSAGRLLSVSARPPKPTSRRVVAVDSDSDEDVPELVDDNSDAESDNDVPDLVNDDTDDDEPPAAARSRSVRFVPDSSHASDNERRRLLAVNGPFGSSGSGQSRPGFSPNGMKDRSLQRPPDSRASVPSKTPPVERVCYAFAQTGQCSKAAECRFSHDMQQVLAHLRANRPAQFRLTDSLDWSSSPEDDLLQKKQA